jgi:16S rRNA (guanine966-N2)-methyltransferase
MRIVEGKWAGKDLISPGGRVRPTAEELRTMMMEILQNDLPSARCLDLFAGTGALGLEALSRGARFCDFVENSASAMHSLKANIAKLKARNQTRIFDRDAIPFVERITQIAYDIAFADPPYGSRKLDRIVSRWLEQPFSALLVLEHAADYEIKLKGRTRRLADSAITVARAPASARRSDEAKRNPPVS